MKSSAASTYTCLAIALERFLGICRAQYGNTLVVRKARYYIFGILFITLIVDASRFFELQPTFEEDGELNGFEYSSLRKHQTYVKVYTLWFRLIMTATVPTILMVFLYMRIAAYFRKNK